MSISGAMTASGLAAPGSPFRVEVPQLAVVLDFDRVVNGGIQVVASDGEVNVVLHQTSDSLGGDARALIHPIEALGDEYILEMFATANPGGHQVTVAAMDDGTTVTVDPACAGARLPFTFSLDRGQAYQFFCDPGLTLAGSRITANRPVAVLAADDCVYLPDSSCCCDPLLYMPVAVPYWGTRYHVPALPRGAGAPSDSDYVRVQASQDGTSLSFDDGAPQSLSLDRYETATFETGRPAVVSGDKPISVYQYVKSGDERGGRGNEMGDPSILPIVPASGFHTGARFLADSRYFFGDFVTVVLGPEDPCRLTLDGNAIPGPWTSFPGGDGVRYTELQLTDDLEHVIESSGPIGVYSHAYGKWVSITTDVGRRFESPGSCQVSAGLCTGRAVVACAGVPFTIDASESSSVNCSGGLAYEWQRDGIPEPTWTGLSQVSTSITAETEFTVTVSCSGDPTCAETRTVVASLDPDVTPGDQGNVLKAVRSGGDVRLEFPGAPATAWRIYRDGTKTTIGTSGLVPDLTQPWHVDIGAAAPPDPYFYAVRGLSPCSRTAGP